MTNRKTVRIILWLFLLGLIVAFSSIYYVFNKPRRDIAKESPAYTVGAKQLISEFQNDEATATAKYLDKVIMVSGEIKSIRTLDNHSMVFSLENEMEGVSCTIDSADVAHNTNKIFRLKIGSNGQFKGRCSGMLMDIQIINSVPE